MTPLIHLEPEVMLSRMQREAFAKAVAQATRDQGSDWVASAVPKSSQRPGAPASIQAVSGLLAPARTGSCQATKQRRNDNESLIMCTAVALDIFRAQPATLSALSLRTKQFKSKTFLCSAITVLSVNLDPKALAREAGFSMAV